MKFYFRIVTTGMVMICLIILTIAGGKKCHKGMAMFSYQLTIYLKTGAQGEKEPDSSNKEYCTSSHFIIRNMQVEEYIKPHPEAEYVTTDFPFQEQEYTDRPFAPPRFI